MKIKQATTPGGGREKYTRIADEIAFTEEGPVRIFGRPDPVARPIVVDVCRVFSATLHKSPGKSHYLPEAPADDLIHNEGDQLFPP